jgi:hypothetical protein
MKIMPLMLRYQKEIAWFLQDNFIFNVSSI